MNVDEIKHQLSGLSKLLLAKKLERPNVFVQLNVDAMDYGALVFYDEGEYQSKGFWEDDIGVLLNQMWNFVREIPDQEDRARERYFKKVSEAVEYGRSMGVDQALINPLLEQMKKLSANIIEHKPRSGDDDIPF